MATEMKNTEKSAQPTQKKRRRKKGVPTLLVIVLLVIAIIMGGLAGFAIARQTDSSREQLQAANAKIMELENTLTLIGFSTETDDAEQWIFDDTGETNGLEDLSGDLSGTPDQDVSALWTDDTILNGTLTEPSEPVVVAEFDGGQLMSDEVIPEYNDQLTTQIFAGYNAEDISDSILQEVLSYMVSDKLIAVKAQELNLDELTDEDLAAIDAEANRIYNEQLSYYVDFVTEPGMSEDEINAAAAQYMESEEGVTLESITNELKETWWAQKFYDYTVKDVTVTDEEVQAHYNDLLASQKTTFAEYPEDFEYAHINGETIVYRPEGYRAVRHILINFDNLEDTATAMDLMDQIALLDPAADAATIQEYQTQLDALFEPLEAKAAEIESKLQSGQSFESLMDEYGQDEMLKTEPLHSEGYYISSNSSMYSSEFIEGSMMLEKPGDVSSPLRSPEGIHLVEYTADIPAGEVPFADVADLMKEETLSLKQSDYYESQRTVWLEEANVKYYPERLQ